MEITCYMEWNYTVILNENILLYVMEYLAIWKGINCHMEWKYTVIDIDLLGRTLRDIDLIYRDRP